MLNLPALHTYLTQLLSPTDTINTALLLTPEGAVVSFACSSIAGCGESNNGLVNATRPFTSSSIGGNTTPPPQAQNANGHTTASQVRTSPKANGQGLIISPETVSSIGSRKCSVQPQTLPLQFSKDNIWILAGLSAELWAETRGEGDESGVEIGMVESEVRVAAFSTVFTFHTLFEFTLRSFICTMNSSSYYTSTQ